MTNRDGFFGGINLDTSGTIYTVSVGSSSEVFTRSGSTFTSQQQSGSTLSATFSGNTPTSDFIYVTADGTIYDFSPSLAGVNPTQANEARLTLITTPAGEVTYLTYDNVCLKTCTDTTPISYRLSSVSNNRGLEITYSYASTTGTGRFQITSLQAFNLSGACATSNQCGVLRTLSVSGNSYTDSNSDALNGTTSYGTPAAGSTQTITRPSGVTTTIVYDSSSRVTSVSNGVGTWTYCYNTCASTGGANVVVTDPNTNKRTVSLDANGRIISDTDALGHPTTYTYDSYGRLTQVIYPHGNGYAYQYDGGASTGPGNVTQITALAASGSGQSNIVVQTAAYNCSSQSLCSHPTWTKDAYGAETDYTYDTTHMTPSTNNPIALLTQVDYPAAGPNNVRPEIRYSYTPENALIGNGSGGTTPEAGIYLLTGISSCGKGSVSGNCVGTSDEQKTTITYDPNHNLAPVSITVAAGDGSISSTQSFTYDAYGNLATSTSPLGAVTTYAYDADRELTAVTGPDPDGSGPLTSAAAQLTYDGGGRVSSTATGSLNAQGGFVMNTYESRNYDGAGRLSGVFEGNVTNGGLGPAYAGTQYQYDNANRLMCVAVRMNMADASLPGACTQSTAGNDGPDRITLYSYNNDDSLYYTETGYGTPSARMAKVITYNSDGTVGILADGKNNATCLGRDGFGRVNVKYLNVAGQSYDCDGSDYETYAYDSNGKLSSKRFRDGSTVSYTRDALGRVTSDGTTSYSYDNNSNILTSSSGSYSLSFTYDALGRKTQEGNNYGGTISSAYDAGGDRTRLTWQDGQYITYNYDLLGRVTNIEENGATSGVGVLATYVYDSFGRFHNAAFAGSSGSNIGEGMLFGSDSRPAITSYGFADSTKNLQIWTTYNAAGGVKVSSLTNNLYDWNGNYFFAQNYTVNDLNQITTAGSSTFGYTAKGALQSDGTNSYSYSAIYNQLSAVSGGASANLTYDGLQRLAQTQGSATTRFTYDGSMITEEQDTSGDVLRRYVPGPDGSPLLWYEGSGLTDRRWLMKDNHGSVIAVANSSGQLLAENIYDPYGLGGSSNLGRFQYAGYAFIPEAGLYNTGARSYSPTLGRFLQTDPSGYKDGMNWYAYAHDDPVNGTDPTGLSYTSCFGNCDPAYTSGPGGGGGTGGGQPGDTPGHFAPPGSEGLTQIADADADYNFYEAYAAAERAQAASKLPGSSPSDSQQESQQMTNNSGLTNISYMSPLEHTAYRVVDMAELTSLEANAFMFTPAPNGGEEKYFWLDPLLGTIYAGELEAHPTSFADPPYHLVQTEIPDAIYQLSYQGQISDFPVLGPQPYVAVPNAYLKYLSPAQIIPFPHLRH